MRSFFSRLYRQVAGFLALTVLTVGIAMAGYVCPQWAQPEKAVEAAMEGMPCSDMDAEKPVQCAEFLSPTQLALEHLAAPAALEPVTTAVIRPAPVVVTPLLPILAWDALSPSPGTDPPYLRTLRLRI